MRVAVTGGTGHLGGSIIRQLLSKNDEVKALVRDEDNSLKGLRVEMIKGSLFDRQSLKKLVDGCDAVIHSAARISINGDADGRVYQTNVTGTSNVLEAAIASGLKRMVHISSIHAYEQQPTFSLLNEESRFVNENAFAYDKSKLAAQRMVLNANGKGIESIVLNPTALIGPPDTKPSLMGKAIINMYMGRIPAVIDGGFDFCDVRDVAAAVVNALIMGRPGQNYLLGGRWYSIKSFSEILAVVSGKKIKLPALPAYLAKTGLPFVKLIARIKQCDPLYTNESIEALVHGNRFISAAKAEKELLYTTRKLEETLKDTFNWFKDNGYLK